MAIQVVGGDVEHHRHARPQEIGRVELEGGGLRHHEAVRGEVEGVRAERRADVAPDEQRPHGAADELPRQRRRGRLPVGAGDRDEVGLHDAPAELELADQRHATGAHSLQGRQLEGHAGAHHDELGAGKGRVGMPAGEERAPEMLEIPRLGGKRSPGSRVRGEHAAAQAADQARGKPLPVGRAPLPRHLILLHLLPRHRAHAPISA